MSFIGLLRTLEQITRPPTRPTFSDTDNPLTEREAETECLVPEDFNAVCRCAACVAEEQASAVEYDNDPSPTIVQSAPPPTVDGEGGGGVLHSPGARLPHSDDAAAEWIGEAVPVISELLAEHPPFYDGDPCSCEDHLARIDFAAWRAHVGPILANALAPNQ